MNGHARTSLTDRYSFHNVTIIAIRIKIIPHAYVNRVYTCVGDRFVQGKKKIWKDDDNIIKTISIKALGLNFFLNFVRFFSI